MNEQSQSYQVAIAELLTILKTAEDRTPIIVDLDETLFLRNSTEEYLNSLQPRFLGWLLLTFLNLIKPWNWLPNDIKGEVSRDWIRVVVATIVFPWTLIVWKVRAKQLAQTYSNTTLIAALTEKENYRIILATQGFGFIINPLCQHFPLNLEQVISCRFWQGFIDRKKGKDYLVQGYLTNQEVAKSIVITDSINDQPLLDSVATPCLVIWPEAEYIPAMADLYIPLKYLEKVKRPGKKYFLRVILLDNFVLLILGLSWLSSQPILHGISVFLLLISFWCIYEVGYVENDVVAEKYEKDPTLSETYHKYQKIVKKINVNSWQPWAWAMMFSLPGIVMLETIKLTSSNISFLNAVSLINLNTVLTNVGLWIGFLVLTRVSFLIYNYVDKNTRVWLYFLLQIYKFFGFLIIIPINMIGVVLFSSRVISCWIPYFIYRFAKTKWPKELPMNMFTILIFWFLIISVSWGSQNISLLLSWQTLVVSVFFLLEGRKDLWNVINQVKLISQDMNNTD